MAGLTAFRRGLPKPLRVIWSRPRLFLSVLAGIAVGLVLPDPLRPVTRSLIGWNVTIWLYLVAALAMILRAEQHDVRRRAIQQDEGRHAILLLSAAASAVSFGGIFAELANIKDLSASLKAMHIGLAVATIVGSWLFVHMIFALHYAHDYYLAGKKDAAGKWCGGIEFPGASSPDYFDFLYFSYIIGVACQTADVAISSPGMRRLALLHGVLSFFFNNAVLAMTINIGAGFIGG